MTVDLRFLTIYFFSIRHGISIAAAAILSTFLLSANAEETLHISFDSDFSGKIGDDTLAATLIGKPKLQAGKLGLAMETGSHSGFLKFPSKNVINPSEGTVAMWIKPIDWEPMDNAFHVFFQSTEKGGLVLYKYFSTNQMLMLSTEDMQNGPYFSIGTSIHWNPGQWHHIAGTWSSDGLQLFIDGTPVSKYPFEADLSSTIGAELIVGDQAWGSNRNSSSLVDDIRIFNNALTPSQVADIYSGRVISYPPNSPKSVALEIFDPSGKAADQVTNSPAPPPVLPPIENQDINSENSRGPIGVSIPGRLGVSNNQIQLWNRRYSFELSALPTQMESIGRKLLSAPVNIIIKDGERKTDLISSNASITQAIATDEVVVKSRLSAANIVLDIESTTERDGLISIELSLAKDAIISDDTELTIEIPLNAELLQYQMHWSSGASDAVEKLPLTRQKSSFAPYYWFGNDTSGLFWFSDSGRTWPNALNADAIDIERIGKILFFKTKIKGRGQKIGPGWRYRFGLQATPVKALPSDWRSWRIAPASGADMEFLWPVPKQDSLKYYGYPEAANSAVFQKRIDSMHQINRKAIPYICPSFVSTSAPEWKANRDQWMFGLIDSTSSDVLAMGSGFAATNPSSISWRNFFSKKSSEFVRKHNLDGAYFDNAQPHGSYNPKVGIGYLAGGKAQKDYPIFQYRELYKKTVEAIKGGDAKKRIIAHTSGHFAVPMLAFADAYVNGEQYRGVVKDNYLDVLNLDQLRTEFSAHQWGLISFFLPEFDSVNAQKVEPTRGLMALLMLHDINIWPGWCNVSEVNRALNALDRYHHASSTFIPYFDPRPMATVADNKMLVSSYKKTDRDFLMIAVNVSKHPIKTQVCVAGPNPHRFMTWPEEKPIATADNHCVDISVNVQDYAMLRVVGLEKQ